MRTRTTPKSSSLIGRHYGMLEYFDAAHIRGWCLKSSSPGKAVNLKIYVCGVLVGKSVCNARRSDLGNLLKTETFAGFYFSWEKSRKKSLRRALAKMRTMDWNRDASEIVSARIDGTLLTVSDEHLHHFCPRLSIGSFYAALEWLGQTTSRASFSARKADQSSAHDAILIVVHDTLKFGAQLFITRFAEWLAIEAPDIRLEFLVTTKRSDKSGESLDQSTIDARLQKMGPVYYLDGAGVPENLVKLNESNYGLLYLNSLASLYCMGRIPPGESPMLIHAHELHWAAGFLLSAELRQGLKSANAHFIGCSNAVRDMLKDELSLPGDRVSLVHSFVPDPPESSRVISQQRRSPPRILIAGSVGWRKGAYLIGAIAKSLHSRFGIDVDYLWVGDIFDKNAESALLHEFSQLGLSGKLQLAGHRESMDEAYREASVLLLPSIEDPFPLVMIEAGLAELPIVAFDGSGGAAEFIGMNNGGIAVPHLDIHSMAEALHMILSDPKKRLALGQNARVTAEQFTTSMQAPKLLSTINQLRNNH